MLQKIKKIKEFTIYHFKKIFIKNKIASFVWLFISAATAAKLMDKVAETIYGLSFESLKNDIPGFSMAVVDHLSNIIHHLIYAKGVMKIAPLWTAVNETMSFMMTTDVLIFLLLMYVSGKIAYGQFHEFFEKKIHDVEKLPKSCQLLVSYLQYPFGGSQSKSESEDNININENFQSSLNPLAAAKIFFDTQKQKYVSWNVNPYEFIINLKDEYLTCFVLNLIYTQTSEFSKQDSKYHIKISENNTVYELAKFIENFKANKSLQKKELQLANKLFNNYQQEEVEYKKFMQNVEKLKIKNTLLPLIEFSYMNNIKKIFLIQDNIAPNLKSFREECIKTIFKKIFNVLNIYFEKNKMAPEIFFHYYGHNHNKENFYLSSLQEKSYEDIKKIFQDNEDILSEEKGFFIQGTSNTSALYGYIAESTNSHLIVNEYNYKNQVKKEHHGWCRYSIVKFDPPIKPFSK